MTLPGGAVEVFADRAELAVEYSRLLATAGIERGLIGPREAPRIWERHVVNSAALASIPSEGATVIDVGSGAGLPGIPLALARPDCDVVLLEPLLRRVVFLDMVIDQLELGDRVRVVRGRAEERRAWRASDGAAVPETFDVVTCRAVAALDKLLDWCLPLLATDGELVALKGERGEQELRSVQKRLERMGWSGDVVNVRAWAGAESTFAVRIRK